MTQGQDQGYDWAAQNEVGGQMAEGEHDVYVGRYLLGNETGPFKPDDGFPTMRLFFVNQKEEEASCFVSLGPKAHFPNRSIASLCRAIGHSPQELASAGLRPVDFESDAVFTKYLAGRWLRIRVEKSNDGKYINVRDFSPANGGTAGQAPPAPTPPKPAAPTAAATPPPAQTAPPVTNATPPQTEAIDTSIDAIEPKPYTRPDKTPGTITVLATSNGRFGIVDKPGLVELATAAKASNEIIRIHFSREGPDKKRLVVFNIIRIEREAETAGDAHVGEAF